MLDLRVPGPHASTSIGPYSRRSRLLTEQYEALLLEHFMESHHDQLYVETGLAYKSLTNIRDVITAHNNSSNIGIKATVLPHHTLTVTP